MVVTRAGYLLPAPFADFLAARVAEAGGFTPLAEALGVDAARVRRLASTNRSGNGETGLLKATTADDWLTRLGGSVAQLYGPLYGLAIPETDACGDHCLSCGEPLRDPAPLCGFCVEEGGTS